MRAKEKVKAGRAEGEPFAEELTVVTYRNDQTTQCIHDNIFRKSI